MPFSSRNLTSEASLNRGGGCVAFCSGVSESSFRVSPCFSGGSFGESLSVSSSLLAAETP